MSKTEPGSKHWQSLLQLVATAWPPARWRDLGVVVGCSGGADSVALLMALSELRCAQPAGSESGGPRGFLVAAHFNHRLRGAESDGDEAFVRNLANQLGVRFAVCCSDGVARDEAALRSQRLKFLSKTAAVAGARYVAVAHSLDDNVETVLHHLVRGTGPAGLAGISDHRSLDSDLVLVRPMLKARRTAIRLALKENHVAWREDSSNQSHDYRRNWIRHKLVPLIESQYPSATDAIGRAIAGQQQWRETIERPARDWLDRQICSDSPLTLKCDSMTDRSIVIVALQLLWRDQRWRRAAMQQSHWLRLAESLSGSSRERYSLPAALDVSCDGRYLQIKSSATANEPRIAPGPDSRV